MKYLLILFMLFPMIAFAQEGPGNPNPPSCIFSQMNCSCITAGIIIILLVINVILTWKIYKRK